MPKLSLSFKMALNRLSSDNPFLAGIITQMIEIHLHAGFIFRYKEALALIGVLYKTGYAAKLNSSESIASDPNIFWDLVDCALLEPLDGVVDWNRGVYGVLSLYRFLESQRVFNKEFIENEKSVYIYVKYKWFSDFLHTRYKGRQFYFNVRTVSSTGRAYVYIDKYKSPYLLATLTQSFARHRSITRSANYAAYMVLHFESLFKDPEKIRDYSDLTPERLDDAIRAIQARFPGSKDEEKCVSWMKALFGYWSDQVIAHPEHDFFSGSFMYTVDFIINARSAVWLGQRYTLVAAGMHGELPALYRALFIVRRNNLRTASGSRYMQRSVDFADFPEPLWRRAFVNYVDMCVAQGNTNYKTVRMFARWMMERKLGSKHPYHISFSDMVQYRVNLLYSNRNATSRNTIIIQVRAFMRWAVKSGFLTAETGYLKGFKGFKYHFGRDAKSLSKIEIIAISDALRRLAEEKNEPRYLLSDSLGKILLYSEARAGQLCAISLSSITFNADGSATVTSRVKNRGKSPVNFVLCKEAVGFLRDAMDVSREVRRKCPVGGPKDQVFLYYVTNAVVPFAVMDVYRFNSDLEDACRYIGMKKVKSGNYRDTYFTTVRRFRRMNGLTDLEEKALTGHARRASTNQYDDIDLRDIIRATRGIIIGQKKQ